MVKVDSSYEMTVQEEAEYLENERLSMMKARKGYDYFRQTLTDADRNGLGFEFMESFVHNIKTNYDMYEASWHAAMEWDF